MLALTNGSTQAAPVTRSLIAWFSDSSKPSAHSLPWTPLSRLKIRLWRSESECSPCPPRETQAGEYEVILPIFPWACPGGRGFQKTGAYNHQTSCVVWLFPSWKQSSSKVAKGGLLKKAYGTTYHKILLISPPPPLVALNWLKERFIIIMFYAWRLVKWKLVFSTNTFCVDSDKTSVKVVFCLCISERILNYPGYKPSRL